MWAFYERALAIRQQALGDQHPGTAQSLNNLGFLLDSLGDYEAARPYYERALAIFEAKLGPDHPYTRTVCGNLAGLAGEAGRLESLKGLKRGEAAEVWP